MLSSNGFHLHFSLWQFLKHFELLKGLFCIEFSTTTHTIWALSKTPFYLGLRWFCLPITVCIGIGLQNLVFNFQSILARFILVMWQSSLLLVLIMAYSTGYFSKGFLKPLNKRQLCPRPELAFLSNTFIYSTKYSLCFNLVNSGIGCCNFHHQTHI